MKKISAIIAVAAISTVFAVAGCQKQEAPKPVVESTTTSTTVSAPTATMTTTTTTTTPATK